MKKPLTTVEEIYGSLGMDAEKNIPDVANCPEEDKDAIIAFAKRLVVTRHLNNGKKVDWTDPNQRKYFPWDDVVEDKESPLGFRLSFYVSYYAYAFSSLGARLHLLSSDMVKFEHEHFRHLKEAMLFEPKSK